MGRGVANVNWPWRWLLGDPTPGEYQVPESIQPTLEVGQAWPRDLHTHTADIVPIAGTVTLQLPMPDVGRVRLYTRMTMEVSDGSNTTFLIASITRGDNPLNQIQIAFFQVGVTSFLAGFPYPVIGGQSSVITAAAGTKNFQPTGSVYVRNGDTLRVLDIDSAGGGVFTVRAEFLEGDANSPLFI